LLHVEYVNDDMILTTKGKRLRNSKGEKLDSFWSIDRRDLWKIVDGSLIKKKKLVLLTVYAVLSSCMFRLNEGDRFNSQVYNVCYMGLNGLSKKTSLAPTQLAEYIDDLQQLNAVAYIKVIFKDTPYNKPFRIVTGYECRGDLWNYLMHYKTKVSIRGVFIDEVRSKISAKAKVSSASINIDAESGTEFSHKKMETDDFNDWSSLDSRTLDNTSERTA